MGFSLSSLFGDTAKGLVEGVGKIADTFITSPDEKKAFTIELEKLAQEKVKEASDSAQSELDSYLKDTQDARDANVKIQESEKASWLSKNVAYCIDIFVMLVWGFLTVYLLCVMLNLVKKDSAVDYTAVTAVWGGVTAFAGTILNFHRGSSIGSKSAGAALQKIAQEK